MDFISKEDFLKLEKYNVEQLGISKQIIIENASVKFVKHINTNLRETFAVVCGNGDNGAYGLAIARNLVSIGKYVEIFLVETQEKSSVDFDNQYKIIEKLQVRVNTLETLEELGDFSRDLRRVNTIVDSITGIDYQSSFAGATEYIIDSINKSRIYTLSVDIPSGTDYDTGLTKVQSVHSDVVVTFHKMKKFLSNQRGLYNTKIVVEKIGLLERGDYVRY